MTFKTSTLEKLRSKNEKKSSSKVDYFIVLWLVLFFVFVKFLLFFFAWQFNGNVNMKSQRSVPKIIAKTRFGWYFCSMSVHHCRPIRWWTGGGMTWSYIAKKKKNWNTLPNWNADVVIENIASIIIDYYTREICFSFGWWLTYWMDETVSGEKRETAHTHTHTEFILLTTR